MKFSVFTISLFLLAYTLASQADSSLNPNFVYLYKGELVGSRGMTLADPKNWSMPVTNRTGVSASKKISVAPIDFKDKNDAIQLTWNKKKLQGSFGIYGSSMDLSKVKDAVYLTIDMRIDSRPDKNVAVSIDCGYPCKAEININHMIKKMPKDQWFSLPIPLNCFKSDNFDLSKVVSPFGISTDGQLGISITAIRLEKLEDGNKGCAENK